jgi:hypothetical protein
MPITGDYAALEEQIKRLHKLQQYSCAADIAQRANDQLTADELAIFDSRVDPATGAAWDANLDGSQGDQTATGAGRGSIRFEARGYRVRLKFADHLRWNLSWRRGQGRGGAHKQNFIPSMSKLPPAMLATLCRVAREVLEEYTGLQFKGDPA